METITPKQNARLHQLLAECGLKEEKRALVRVFSATGSESSRDLAFDEARKLIAHLEERQATPDPKADKAAAADKMRRKVLSLAHELRWELPDGKVDMPRVNAWCQSKGFGKKGLNYYTHAELTKLVSQLKIVYTKYMKERAQ